MKLETWLRIAGIPYELGPFPAAIPPPKGKWPYIEDDGLVLGDSTLIIDYLKRSRQVDPDQSLTPTERAIGVAFRRMLKENLYWTIIQMRYREQAGWDIYRAVLRPGALALFGGDEQKADELLENFGKGILDQMLGHGMGRHSAEEVHQIASSDLIAVSDFLGDKAFFFGDQPTGVDATVYAYVANVIDVPLDSPSTRIGRQRKNLVDYCRRMRERFFSDLPRSEQYDRACASV
jgi:glutathione S-transferase